MPLEAHRELTFHVQDLGGGEGARTPVVMLHGLLVGSLASWYFTCAPALAEARRVRLFDLRGHGKSARATSGYDVPTMAGDLDAVASALTREPVDLVGHSYGAAVALHFALRHPERVRRLVLVDAPLPPSRLRELDDFLGMPPEAMARALPGVLQEALARKGRQAARFVDALRFLTTETSLFADLRRAEDVPDDALSRLACPLLCVYGRASSCLPVGQRIAAAVPGARLVVMDGGHFLPIEAPRALGAHLLEFLDG